MQFTYYQPRFHPPGVSNFHLGGERRPSESSWYRSFEIAIGALLLLSPMFWLFIAELIK
jgi:hypothetical protein